MMPDYSTSRKKYIYGSDLFSRKPVGFCSLEFTPSNGYLASNLVKTDVMWSSSGGKKVKQPLVRAKKKWRKSLFIIYLCYYGKITIYY